MDEFKKYLQQHRDELDTDTPPARLLQRIQQQTAVKKKNKLFTIVLRTAAAACTVTIIALSIKWMMKEPGTKKQDISKVEKTENLPAATVTLTDTSNKNLIANPKVPDDKNQNSLTKKIKQKKEPLSYRLMHSFEQNYTQLVSLQLKSIRSTPLYGETQDYFNDFKKTLKQIGTDEAAIRINIKTNGLNDELLEQLINVYEQKINVLKDLQHEMNKMNRKVKENQLPSDTLKTNYINI